MLIGQFCRATGLPRDTVRFYVRQGLLTPDTGTKQSNRYLVFDPSQVERARLIKAAQSLGFSLRDIRDLDALYSADTSTTDARKTLLQSRIADLNAKLRTLTAIRTYFEAKLHWLDGGAAEPEPVFVPE